MIWLIHFLQFRYQIGGGAAAVRRGGGGGGLTNIDAATTFSSFENQSNSLSHNLVLGYQSMEDF